MFVNAAARLAGYPSHKGWTKHSTCTALGSGEISLKGLEGTFKQAVLRQQFVYYRS